jgi:HAD domain in Swiss Army Knife RNA repair proteins
LSIRPFEGHPPPPDKPILAIDIDGVISLFGFEERPLGAEARLQLVDGIPHYLSVAAGERLVRLAAEFELVWASGWEDKANFYLPQALGLPELPHIAFDAVPRSAGAHWKLAALEAYVGSRAVAWIDDNFDSSCYEWGERRPFPTLLVPTEPHLGLEEAHVDALTAWATSLDPEAAL